MAQKRKHAYGGNKEAKGTLGSISCPQWLAHYSLDWEQAREGWLNVLEKQFHAEPTKAFTRASSVLVVLKMPFHWVHVVVKSSARK